RNESGDASKNKSQRAINQATLRPGTRRNEVIHLHIHEHQKAAETNQRKYKCRDSHDAYDSATKATRRTDWDIAALAGLTAGISPHGVVSFQSSPPVVLRFLR